MVASTTNPTTSPAQRVSASSDRSSLFGRLSLSPSKRGHKAKSAVSRGILSSNSLQDSAAGPSYEAQSWTAGPTSDPPAVAQQPSRGVPAGQALRAYAPVAPDVTEYRGPIYQSPSPASFPRTGQHTDNVGVRSPPVATQSPTTSPPRQRQPIYPALASPPRPRAPKVNSPPPVSHQWSLPANNASRTPGELSIDTSVVVSPPRRRSSPRVSTSGSSLSPGSQRPTMEIIASSNGHHDKTALPEKGGQRHDKHGRPLMSARRSATSSSKTITRADSSAKTSLPRPMPSQDPRTVEPFAEEARLTEASAYARAIASDLARPGLAVSQTRTNSTGTISHVADASRGPRPLPRPPNETFDLTHSSAADGQTQGMSHAESQKSLERVAQDGLSPATTPSKFRRDSAIEFDFPRSPTVPALVDPRIASAQPAGLRPSDPARMQQTPPRPRPGSPLNSSLLDSTKAVNGSELRRPRSRAPIHYLLSHPAIQSSLLSAIGINAFLSLTGSSENIRQQFTGESVGRWVLREWGVQIPPQLGVRWPNLTVWEGFLESLLHDPATYSTYPARWHNLLRHLALSHSLVVLYLRNLPTTSYPNHSLLPFEDESPSSATIPFSASSTSLASLGQPRSRVGSVAGSDVGNGVPSGKPPRRERVIEIVMPEPLAAQPSESFIVPEVAKPMRRRGSISSLASAASFSFGRRRSNSTAIDARPPGHVNGMSMSMAEPTASMPPGKGSLPPVSYPSAKRYAFKNVNEQPNRSRQTSLGQRPGSVFSMQTSPSVSSYAPRMSQTFEHRAPHMTNFQSPLAAPPPIGVRPRSSFGSTNSTRRSERDQNSPGAGRRSAFPGAQTIRNEPAFDRPMPYIPGRAPVLRVFVPLSESVRRWPSAEGAEAAIEELEKCGALKRMQLGDLIVNTAIRAPRTTEHVLLYVPFVRHQLVPLQYVHNTTGHLPAYVDAFALPPSYYYPFLPAPQIIHLNLGPYREQGLRSMRLASDRRDVTIASGAKIAAKRFLYVAGVEIKVHDKAAIEWHGMVSLEAEGTAEGKADLEARFGPGGAQHGLLAPWEIIKEKSMGGTVWLRLVKEKSG